MIERLATALDDPLGLAISAGLNIAGVLNDVAASATSLAHRVRGRDAELIRQLIKNVRVLPASVELVVDVSALASLLGVAADQAPKPFVFGSSVRLTRSGHAMRLIEGGKQPPAKADRAMIRLIVQARRYWAELRKGELNVTELAEREKVGAPYITRVLRLAFLSPQVVEAVLAGKQRAVVTPAQLLSTGAIDPRWDRQARAFAG